MTEEARARIFDSTHPGAAGGEQETARHRPDFRAPSREPSDVNEAWKRKLDAEDRRRIRDITGEVCAAFYAEDEWEPVSDPA